MHVSPPAFGFFHPIAHLSRRLLLHVTGQKTLAKVMSVWIMFPKNLSVTVLRRSLAASGDLVVGVRCLPQVLQLLLLGVLWERV